MRKKKEGQNQENQWFELSVKNQQQTLCPHSGSKGEIKYMCTINLSPNEIICSSCNHHGKQVHNTQ